MGEDIFQVSIYVFIYQSTYLCIYQQRRYSSPDSIDTAILGIYRSDREKRGHIPKQYRAKEYIFGLHSALWGSKRGPLFALQEMTTF